jgi:hypothetical protein
MITLNTEKGLVRLDSWDDVMSRPGYVANLDPRTTRLVEVLGNYTLFPFLQCGLSTCHTSHGKGYLVVTSDGRETNIGQDCGRKYFGLEFKRLAKAFDQHEQNQRRRVALVALQHRIPTIEARIATLMDEPLGARWVNRHATRLIDPLKGLPKAVTNIMGGLLRRRTGALTRSRVATKEDLQLMRAQGQRIQSGANYIEEVIGQVEGISALYKENDLRRLLVLDMANLALIKGLDIDSMKDKMLRDLAKWGESVEPALAQAEEALATGRRLLTQANMRQLLAFTTSREDRQTLTAFIAELPEAHAAPA